MTDLTIARPTHWHRWLWAVLGLALLAPLIAMQFTAEVNWSAFDFVAGGLLLSALGLSIEVILNRLSRRRQPIALIVVAAMFGAIWVEMATGFI